MPKTVRNEKQLKKRAIIKAGVEAFSKFGFHKSTMRQIAEMANMAVGTIYLYFKSKDEILNEIFDNEIEQHLDRLFDKIKELPPVEALKIYYSSRFMVIRRNLKLVQLLTREAQNNKKLGNILYKKVFEKVMDTLRDYLNYRIEKGDYKKFNVEIVTILLFSVSTHIVIWKELMFEALFKELSYEAFAETIADLFSNGLLKTVPANINMEGMK